MGKKGLLAVLVVYFLLILLISMFVFQIVNVHAQEEIPGLPSGLSPEEVEKTQEKIEGKWDYLAREWKNIFLKNKFVSAIDSFFTKISIVFRILFGMDYSLSLTLLIVIIMWFYFFINIAKILTYFSTFSSSVSFVISLALAVILAQFKVYEKIAQFFIWLIFGDKPWWLSLIITIVLIVVLVVLYQLNKGFAGQIAARRKAMKKEMEELKLKMGAKAGEALSEAAKELGKK